MIIVRGTTCRRKYDFECELISRTRDEAVFETKSEPKHIIKITPRYVGSGIGSCDFVDEQGKNVTVCAFLFDGKYVAIGLFSESGEDIEIVPRDY